MKRTESTRSKQQQLVMLHPFPGSVVPAEQNLWANRGGAPKAKRSGMPLKTQTLDLASSFFCSAGSRLNAPNGHYIPTTYYLP